MARLSLGSAFSDLSTPLIVDACLRLKRQFHLAPPDIRPLIPESRVAGRVLPARHYGSVDVFLEAMLSAEEGDVLVIDNGGRRDEACIGDLTVLEAKASGLSGVVVWGCHRDTRELMDIGFPIFSQGAVSAGPQRLDRQQPDALTTVHLGGFSAGKQDLVFADDDGVVFTRRVKVEELLAVATSISKTEKRQADAIRAGMKLRDQLQFRQFLDRHTADPSYTFRKHLRSIGGEIEE